MAGLVLLALSVLILLGGNKFWLNTTERKLIAIAVIILLVLVAFIIARIRAVHASQKLEKSLKAQADEQVLNARPEKKAQAEEFKKQFLETIEKVKRTKLAGGKSGTAALYALPWYMMIGPSAAGKTTALTNSGLEFPYGATGVQGVGGTRHCHWFFSQSAIFLDTAGRYVNDDEDKEEWDLFLGMLKKYRRRQPINGVLVGMTIEALLKSSSPEEIDEHAQRIRARIDELIERLGRRFPVYLIFTKCDLLQGFREFFGALSKAEREQIFGCTFSPEQQRQNDARGVFAEEFKALQQSLTGWRMNRLGLAASRTARRHVYVFPHQFFSLQENLANFISRLFQHNPYKDNPVFRGFYFTSGTQEGTPIDLAIQALAKEFGFAQGPVSDEDAELEKKSYFIKELFSKVIVSDRHLAGFSRRAKLQYQVLQWAALLAMALPVWWFACGVSRDCSRSRGLMAGMVNLTENVKNANKNQPAGYFKKLDDLSGQLIELEDQQNNPDFWSWRLYRGDQLVEPGHAIYDQKFRPFVYEQIYRGLENKLRSLVNTPNVEPSQIYDYLQAYLLLGGAEDQLARDNNPAFLVTQSLLLLDENYLSRYPRPQTQTWRPYVEYQIKYFVDGLVKGYWDSFAARQNKNLVQQACAILQRAPNARGLYRRTIDGMKYLPTKTLNNLLDNKNGEIFQSQADVPGAYTQEGWKAFQKEVDRILRSAGGDDWVCGGSQALSSAGINADAMRRDLEQMYFADYARAWWQFMGNLQYADVDNLLMVAERLAVLGDAGASPLLRLFQAITAQTQFHTPGDSVPPSDLNDVERQFADLHEFVNGAPGNGSAGAVTELLGAFEPIRGKVESMQSDPVKAKEYAAQTLLGQANELPGAMSRINGATNGMAKLGKDFVRNLFEQPLVAAWKAILGNAQQYLNEQWENQVHKEFRANLAEYYPFQKDGVDAQPGDVEIFFQPDKGVLWKFYNAELQPFLRQATWTPVSWNDYGGIGFSKTVLEDFRRAEAMANELFKGGTLQLQYSLEPVLPTIQGNSPVSQICITIDNDQDCFRMGAPRPKDFTWPRGDGTTNLIADTQNGRIEIVKNIKGQWGIFHLLEKARIVPQTAAIFSVAWELSSRERDGNFVRVGYTLRARTSSNPFRSLNNDYFAFKFPAQLN